MRRLTSRQKKYLDKVIGKRDAVYSVTDLTNDEWQDLQKINDTEILYQEVNRYLDDKKWEY